MSMEDRGSSEPPALHELEAHVMSVIWKRGESSVRQVMDAVNGEGAKPRAYTTYMTVMSRLSCKGVLVRRREGRTDFYRARYSHAEYANQRARAALDSIVDEFGDLALVHIARQASELDAERRRALETLAREP